MNISLTPEDEQLVKQQIARGRFHSAGEVIHEALRLLEIHEPEESDRTCYDILKESGAIGMIEGGPADLSTNKKYMDGFGES